MKLKYLALPLAGLFAAFFCLLLLVALLFASDEDGGRGGIYYGGANLSAEVLAHRPMVERRSTAFPSTSMSCLRSCRWNPAVRWRT